MECMKCNGSGIVPAVMTVRPAVWNSCEDCGGTGEVRRIWTVGYGIIEGTWPEKKAKFQERLRYIQQGIGKPITVVDIRKVGCGSRNGKAFSMASWGMASIVRELGWTYLAETWLANTWGGSKRQLEKYACELAMSLFGESGKKEFEIREAVARIVAIAKASERTVLLLCGCLKAYKPNGTTPNCHGVPLGEALVSELGEEWEVCHL